VNQLRTLSLAKSFASRRQLLKALGAGAAVAPFVPTLDAWAQMGGSGGKPPQRLLLLFTPDGIVPDLYWPKGSETDFTFPTGGILEPLNRHKADMIVFKDMPRHNGGSGGAHEHAMGGLWTGNSIASNQVMAASADQIIAKGLAPKTDFPSLQFGVMSYYDSGSANAKAASVNSYMIASGPKARMPAEADPYKAFDRVFGGDFNTGMPGAGASTSAPAMDRIRAERKSVLDFLKTDLALVKAKVGKDDIGKIDAHNQSIREIEERLAGTKGDAILTSCKAPDKPKMVDLNKGENLPELCTIVNKIVAATFACDRTRIASLQYSRAFSNAIHTWVGAKETHHTLSHGTQNAPVLAKIQVFYMNHIAQLLDDLKAFQENGKPMLDNMLVVYANELYLGWTHGVSPSPCFWAGKAGGAINRTGRFLDYAGKYDHNQMLQTMAHVMGVKVQKIGDLGAMGTLPDILAT
jgi:hypothetical protein